MAKIRVLGAGFYGCHIGLSLINDGHDVEIHETANSIFAGASGSIPARLHAGCLHYPRSLLTSEACLAHKQEFMNTYGHLTSAVPINIYAIAERDSLIDFGTYRNVLSGQIEFITIDNPHEFGLEHVEGAVLTGERHVVIRKAIRYFESKIGNHVHYYQLFSVDGEPPVYTTDGINFRPTIDIGCFDLTIDCTFCANESIGIDRYEPCLTVILSGPTNKAVTIMDGAFPSLYPWDEEEGLSSLTSARYTPFSKTCKTWDDAKSILDNLDSAAVRQRANLMFEQMAFYYPAIMDYKIVDHKLSIRAMPLSGADARLIDVIKIDEKLLRVRAGKIDAIFQAEREVKQHLNRLHKG